MALGIESGLAIGILAAIIAILMGLPVIFGIKWMANLMKLALPLMILFAAYYLFAKVIPAGSSLFSEAGTGKITFMTGVGMAWSTFVVAGQ